MNSRRKRPGQPAGIHPVLTSHHVQIHRGLPHFPQDRKRIVTTGTFDGVHLGHRSLLQWMGEEARTQGAETVVLTFHPHPREVLFGPNSGLQLLQTMGQRLAHLADTGIDHLVIQPFDRAFSRLRPEEFVRDVLVEGLGTTTIAVGHDHRFGAGREGDVELLRSCGETYGFGVVHIPAHIEGELTVSSTKVRQHLADGNLTGAAALLGRPFSWRGTVVVGAGRGRELGYRTANLEAVDPLQITPPSGVYAAHMTQRSQPGDPEGHEAVNTWAAMVHIGPRPTFDEEGAAPTIEAHLLDADNPNLYESVVDLTLVQHLRDVRKFDNADALVGQLEKDEAAARQALGYA